MAAPLIQRDPKEDPKRTKEQKALLDNDVALLSILRGYENEARTARESGYEDRDTTWEENLDAFWGRYDFSDKKSWQAQEVLPDVANFVERFAAVLRQGLTQVADWAQVQDVADVTGKISKLATKFTRVMLDNSGTNVTGQSTRFEKTFGDCVRTGTMSAMCAAVTWKDGRLHIEEVDPRTFLPDPTGRGLYRIRIIEIDKDKLLRMADEMDSNGDPIWDKDAIEQETSYIDQELREWKERSSGGGVEQTSRRKPMVLWEFYCDLIDEDGKPMKEKQLVVVLNNRTIIRGPEPNPFWHGQDWVVYHPLMSAPMGAVDGKTYVEHFRRLTETLQNVTNMMLDAVQMNGINANVVFPEFLKDPEQLKDGLYPCLSIELDEGTDPRVDPVRPIRLGSHLGPEAFNLYQALNQKMMEGAAQSELSLGQHISGETTATEASLSNRGQSSFNNSIASDIEDHFLAPIVQLAYFTGIQHIDEDTHPAIKGALTEDEIGAFMAQREDFRNRAMRFKAKGITASLERSQMLRGLLGSMNVIGGNPILAEAFSKEYSLTALIRTLLEYHLVDIEKIEKTPQERQQEAMQAQIDQQAMQAQMGAPGEGEGGTTQNPFAASPQTAQNQGGPDPMAGAEGVDSNVVGG